MFDRSLGPFQAAAGSIAAIAVSASSNSSVIEIGVHHTLRIFGEDVPILSIMVSMFAMLTVRGFMRPPEESWKVSIPLTFALMLLQLGAVAQFGLGVFWATLTGFGIGSGGMAIVNATRGRFLKIAGEAMDPRIREFLDKSDKKKD